METNEGSKDVSGESGYGRNCPAKVVPVPIERGQQVATTTERNQQRGTGKWRICGLDTVPLSPFGVRSDVLGTDLLQKQAGSRPYPFEEIWLSDPAHHQEHQEHAPTTCPLILLVGGEGDEILRWITTCSAPAWSAGAMGGLIVDIDGSGAIADHWGANPQDAPPNLLDSQAVSQQGMPFSPHRIVEAIDQRRVHYLPLHDGDGPTFSSSMLSLLHHIRTAMQQGRTVPPWVFVVPDTAPLARHDTGLLQSLVLWRRAYCVHLLLAMPDPDTLPPDMLNQIRDNATTTILLSTPDEQARDAIAFHWGLSAERLKQLGPGRGLLAPVPG
jgi:hypothetical protein